MANHVYNVLFLGRDNSARSIMAESILRRDAAGRFKAFSAGIRPKGTINPLALKILSAYGYEAAEAVSKGSEGFLSPAAPPMDFIFVVSNTEFSEVASLPWPGNPMVAHWGIDDPEVRDGSETEKEIAFNLAFRYLRNRLSRLLALEIACLDAPTLGARLNEIGKIEGASPLPREGADR